MSKISIIANKGIQYDIGGSGGDDIRLVNLDRGFLLLKKVCPGIVIVFLNTDADSSKNISASGDFAGFEGYTKMVMSDSSLEDFIAILEITKTSLRVSFSSRNSYTISNDISCAGTYRVYH